MALVSLLTSIVLVSFDHRFLTITMHISALCALISLVGPSAAHGVVTLIRGANGVDMPGLSSIVPFVN